MPFCIFKTFDYLQRFGTFVILLAAMKVALLLVVMSVKVLLNTEEDLDMRQLWLLQER